MYVFRVICNKYTSRVMNIAKSSHRNACIFTINNRTFSSGGRNELPYGVQSEDANVDIDDIKNYYIPEEVRAGIYQDHKADPKQWSAAKIANHYGMSLNRARAILYLMKSREEMMTKSGAINATPEWEEIFNKSKENPQENTLQNLATDYNKTTEEVKTILDVMEEHTHRLKNLRDSDDYYNDHVDTLYNLGVNVQFREMESVGPNRLAENYFPSLLGDEEFEQERVRLRARLLTETKAQPQITPNTFENIVLASSTGPLPQVSNDSGLQTKFSRWKYAFRETAKKEKGTAPPPTMIRTRDGR
jgi:hypothetical protein